MAVAEATLSGDGYMACQMWIRAFDPLEEVRFSLVDQLLDVKGDVGAVVRWIL